MLQKVAHCLKLPSFVVHLQHEQTWTPKQGNLVCTTFARKWSALRYSCFSGLCWPPKCVRSEKLRDLEAVCYQQASYWPIGSIVLWNIPWIMHKIAGIECRTIGRRYTRYIRWKLAFADVIRRKANSVLVSVTLKNDANGNEKPNTNTLRLGDSVPISQ